MSVASRYTFVVHGPLAMRVRCLIDSRALRRLIAGAGE
jgi:hypothetical protein